MLIKKEPPLPRRTRLRSLRKITEAPTLDQILDDICACFNVSAEMVKSPRQYNKYVIPRRIYCYVAHVLTNESCDSIADFINRDHTTYLDRVDQCFGWFEIDDEKWKKEWHKYIYHSKIWYKYYFIRRSAACKGSLYG